ncbi:hypothetical protein OPTIMUS_5 [Mycobacterium phage Optimus]|uniref:Uncharacterized protein n=1 Tax=Mycobacterium phage Optimus TaxID=2922218 RepID=G1DAE4_9CAUD|nr:hypothetical protein FDG54_gp005 [Mycobacterium phage Optimus]AEJ92313.1 hypothetical protein OPTIMUS_5 [Mycobacterium phage Optimus]
MAMESLTFSFIERAPAVNTGQDQLIDNSDEFKE